MTLNLRIASLTTLGTALKEDNDARKFAVAKAHYENKWFTEQEVNRMLSAIADHYLQYDNLIAFAKAYDLPNENRTVKSIGLIPAGNIPLVSFHDVLCILLTGHQAIIKLSDKDKSLLPWVIQVLEGIDLELARQVIFVDKLQGFDAIIATGSNNSTETFKRYFGRYPHIIRNNKTGIAILDGKESEDDLTAFSQDIFAYYGLGCRNISKIYVPRDYDFDQLGKALNQHKKVVLHSKYKNNIDYNLAVMMLNKDVYINVASIILVEKDQLHSRIGSLHYEYYDDLATVANDLNNQRNSIQVITCNQSISGIDTKALGMAQQPNLDDYADGVDTVDFLRQLS